ncbi:DUF4129 domain-containing protein [Streptomyces sp. HNM0575]|uniref:DUF4129 domain-containing protein n=1 Tax=Streptomyces sp. HNM0575 TaxID=2716338 RepID=UPI00145D6CC7|nr:DUF4129 domain-containing protein [Streptomyces sp. HNM0575]NLU76703.1 DUF4129 domain-containing protein [Streptomyces sp. HNM0575]
MPGDVATVPPADAAGLFVRRVSGADGGAPVTIPRTPAREAAERELSKGEYHRDDPSLLNRILDWLWDHISSLLHSAAQASPGGWVGLTAIVCLVVLLAVALRLRLGSPRPGPVSDSGTLFDKGPRSAAEHRAAAEAHATAERWDQALQERMRAIVRSLEERALLDHRPGRTADEAAVEADRALPGHGEELRSAARSFDEVTYAGRDSDSSSYAAVRDLDRALQRARPLLPDSAAAPASGALVAQQVRAGGPDADAPDGGGS